MRLAPSAGAARIIRLASVDALVAGARPQCSRRWPASRSSTVCVEQPIEHLGLAPGACRAGRPRDRRPRRESPAAGALGVRNVASRVEPLFLRLRGKLGTARGGRAPDRAAATPCGLAVNSRCLAPSVAGHARHLSRPSAPGKLMTHATIRDCRARRSSRAAVKLHHRLGEAQAEAGARLRAALLQPHETFGDALAVVLVGNARAVVGDAPGRFRRPRAPSATLTLRLLGRRRPNI